MARPFELVVSSSALERRQRLRAFTANLAPREVVRIVGASDEGAKSTLRFVRRGHPATFGWDATTLVRIAHELALPGLAKANRAAIGRATLEALVARAIFDLTKDSRLGRFTATADRPGLARAVARTIEEIRGAELGEASLAEHDRDVAEIYGRVLALMDEFSFVDREGILQAALHAEPVAHSSVAFIDIACTTFLSAKVVAKIIENAERAIVILPRGDVHTRSLLERALGGTLAATEVPAKGPLARLSESLFSGGAPSKLPARPVTFFSAPGESRESVEIARRIQGAAISGVRFDAMAVALRNPEQYRASLLEAFRRAKIPFYFSRGALRPDPTGRAFAALLACRAEDYSARRFAEFLSLGVAKPLDEVAPNSSRTNASLAWAPPDDEILPNSVERTEPTAAPASPNLPILPHGWQSLLVDAAVIGGKDRWHRRLAGILNETELDRHEAERKGEPTEGYAARKIELEKLQAFALPLLGILEALPAEGTWGEWCTALSALASKCLADPTRVLSLLAELAPLADVGPVTLRELRIVLEPRLTVLREHDGAVRGGAVYIATTEELRGESFHSVFVPGLAEKCFPAKVVEDPILRDDTRRALGMTTNEERVQFEKMQLELAIGAAEEDVLLSYPRIELGTARPRTPSFYALEAIAAGEGEFPTHVSIEARASNVAHARVGWPAPEDPQHAIDEAEHDLALIDRVQNAPAGTSSDGAAHYLLNANVHLARALRFRNERFWKNWQRSDGLIDKAGLAKKGLLKHQLAARSFSPTALQNFAACPYRFALYSLMKLQPTIEPAQIEDMDALQRGSLVHEVQYSLLVSLREKGLLPVTRQNLDEARTHLDRVLAEVAAKFHDDLAPSIPRVWSDAIAAIAADLREVLRRSAEDEEWSPYYFELSFGLKERRDADPASVDEPIVLDSGLRLRGSIDLIERRASDGALRVTDYKTGKVYAAKGGVIDGGKTLQPVLYSLVVEKRFPELSIVGGRLYYCTSTGGFTDRYVPLSEEARESADVVAKVVGAALAEGNFPAAPVKDGCRYCDYRPICGPNEEERLKKKSKKETAALDELRKLT